MEFLSHLVGKPVVASPNVACFLRLPCDLIWQSCSFYLIFCLRVCAMMHCWPLNITPSCTECSSRISKYWWMTAGCSSFVSGKPSKIAFFTNCRVGSQAISLWSSLSWWSGTERVGKSEWNGCTPPLILWLIAHSPLNKLLTWQGIS